METLRELLQDISSIESKSEGPAHDELLEWPDRALLYIANPLEDTLLITRTLMTAVHRDNIDSDTIVRELKHLLASLEQVKERIIEAIG